MNTSFTGTEFYQALVADSVPTPVVLTGMVKTAEKTDAIQFAPGTTCQNWTTLPVSLIERVEPLGQMPCDDHTHPVVRIQLTQPGTAEAAALAMLLHAVQQQRPGCGGSPGKQPGQPPNRAAARPPAPSRPGALHFTIPPGSAAAPQAQCVDGDSWCDQVNNWCYGCCNGTWVPFSFGGCQYGMSYSCNGNLYNAYNCWPIA
ncbi:hypothetical protein [Streptomyces silvisoli]|uniref:Uncharacterized protein n=1 Tax=Streptomyces silvisoli TaxID=3034235 RepID=A0ABT5ZWM4_9ACTN|nr:hypothetical protein [Streptomyces silvisoli]MDF3294228.1 hypothetical protein [Streptomyces silvisoli]